MVISSIILLVITFSSILKPANSEARFYNARAFGSEPSSGRPPDPLEGCYDCLRKHNQAKDRIILEEGESLSPKEAFEKAKEEVNCYDGICHRSGLYCHGIDNSGYCDVNLNTVAKQANWENSQTRCEKCMESIDDVERCKAEDDDCKIHFFTGGTHECQYWNSDPNSGSFCKTYPYKPPEGFEKPGDGDDNKFVFIEPYEQYYDDDHV